MAQDAYIGTVIMFGGNFAPVNYQLCQGQILPIAQYSALFAILGTTFGGNGVSTFGLPDFRCRVPVGAGNGPGLGNVDPGQQAGTQNVSLTVGNMPAHTHNISLTVNAAADGRAGSNSPAGAYLDSGTQIFTSRKDGTTMAGDMVTGAISPTGSNLPFNVQNPYLGINFIICINGIFPSRN